jgi:hypothetical protein
MMRDEIRGAAYSGFQLPEQAQPTLRKLLVCATVVRVFD